MENSFNLANVDLLSFLQDNQYNYVSHEEFQALPVPNGMSHEEAWDCLSFARRIQGRPRIDGAYKGQKALAHQSFWVATPAMIESFTHLAHLCAETASLTQELKKPQSKQALQDLLAEELWAAATRDGLSVERETIGSLIRGESGNRSGQELILANCLSLLETMAAKASEGSLPDLTPEILVALYDALCEGVSGIAAEPLKTFAHEVPHEDKVQTEWLEDISGNATLSYHWGPHIFFDMIMNADIFWEMCPFGQFDGLMELVVWHYSCFYHHVPTLRFVPLSKMRLDWELELVSKGSSVFKHGTAIVESRYGLDCTPYLQVMTGLLERGVERLQVIAMRVREADEAHKQIVSADGRLTLRQKSFLLDLMDDPGRGFVLADYQHQFDIALSTARADVEGLVSMRWLDDGFEGKRRVYRLRQ